MKVREIVAVLDELAPPALAANWDNVGLLIGDEAADARKLLLCVDLTPAVLREAIAHRASMVLAYHPVIFAPLKRLTAAAEGVVYQAARAALAVYSPHTALDAAVGGTNDVLADALDLADRQPLEPTVRPGLAKIVAYVPTPNLPDVADAAFDAGAGRIGNYDRCAFYSHGTGTFYGREGSNPTVGQSHRQETAQEVRLEVLAPVALAPQVVAAIRQAHCYEEPAIDVYRLEDLPAGCGMGRVGSLCRPVTVKALVARARKALNLRQVMVSTSPSVPPLVAMAACCAGSCGSTYKAALAAGAQFYLTGEMRHHDLLAATEAGMTVVCTGHWSSERPAIERLATQLRPKLPKVEIVLSQKDREAFEVM